jgi:hypothetical protein
MGGKRAVVSYEFGGSGSGGGNSVSINIDIGTPASDRLVVVADVEVDSGRSPSTISAATLGGVTLTVGPTTTQGNSAIRLLYGVVPTGTSATLDITYGGKMDNRYYSTISLYDLDSSTPEDTNASAGSSPLTHSLSVTEGGVVVSAAGSIAATPYTWTNITEEYDLANRTSGGAGLISADNASYSITSNSGGNHMMASASWR